MKTQNIFGLSEFDTINIRYVLVMLFAVLTIMFLEYMGAFVGSDNYFYDLFFRIRGKRIPDPRIVIVAIDEDTLSQLGRWPLDRSHYADLIDRLRLADVIGFDLLFSESSKSDAALANAINRSDHVVLALYIGSHGKISAPLPIFSRAKSGHVHVDQGIDGIVRGVFHTLYLNDKAVPSFASVIYELLSGQAFPRHPLPTRQSPADIRNAILQRDYTAINYYGPGRSINAVSMAAVIRGHYSKDFFKHKIVLVGLTAKGLGEGLLTPFSTTREKTAGVEVQATIVNNLLDHSGIHRLPIWIRWVNMLVISLVLFLAFADAGTRKAALVWFFAITGGLSVLFALFVGANVWFAPSALLLSISIAFFLSHVFRLETINKRIALVKKEWEIAFDTIDEGIAIHGPDCKIILSNRALKSSLEPWLAGLLEKRCRNIIRHTFSEKGGGQPMETTEPNSGAAEEIYHEQSGRYLEIKSLPLPMVDQRISGMVQIVRDVTESRKTHKEQEILQSKLLQAQKMEAIGTLAGGIAHDFNNILSAIMGYTEITYQLLGTNEDLKSKLKRVLEASERAKALVNQILTFSRQTDPEKRVVDVGFIVKEALKLIRSTIPSNIYLNYKIDPECKVQGDPTQIHQVVMNLCTNAYHAMRQEGGVLSVELKTTTITDKKAGKPADCKVGPYVLLTVSDTGCGIAPENIERIFEPYFTTKKKGEGTGLGLSTVHGIVQNHGGWLSIESRVGQGTRIHVFLPQVKDAIPDQKASIGEIPVAKSGRILLVDDELSLVEVGKEILENLGYEVDTSTNGALALNLFLASPHRYDVIISDMTMPGMTGDVLSREILRIRPDIPIILCTGYSERINEDVAREIGIRKLLMKPYKIDDLIKILSKMLP